MHVKYVITLDTDTQLPRDSAWQFVGAMEHPLNRARYDEDKRRVSEGYAILQPRVAVSLPGTNRSRYAQLFGSDPGIDPYTRAVSDVYQDIFHEGSFIGKGIYDVDAFERALSGRFPENRILSHDLVEGCYARAGLLNDVQLYEEYPSLYSADVSRRHRWIRGDWQIARWLLPGVPGFDGLRQKNPLSGLSRWKIFDNLRRSLVPAALTLLLLLGWTVLSPPWLWTLVVIGMILIPPWIASRCRCALGRPPFCSGGIYARMSTIRGILQPGCDSALGLAASHAQTTSGVESGLRLGSPSPHGPRCLLPDDVDCPCHRHCHCDLSGAFEVCRARRGWPHPGPLAFLPRYRLVDQQASRSSHSKTNA
jgi:hypothetical protein